MGLDLTLLLLEGSFGNHFAHTLLACDRDSEMFEAIRELDSVRMLEPLWTHLARIEDGDSAGESCYGRVTTDDYGEPLASVRAADLSVAMSAGRRCQKNVQAKAYVKAMHPDARVVLFWW